MNGMILLKRLIALSHGSYPAENGSAESSLRSGWQTGRPIADMRKALRCASGQSAATDCSLRAQQGLFCFGVSGRGSFSRALLTAENTALSGSIRTPERAAALLIRQRKDVNRIAPARISISVAMTPGTTRGLSHRVPRSQRYTAYRQSQNSPDGPVRKFPVASPRECARIDIKSLETAVEIPDKDHRQSKSPVCKEARC